MKAALVFDIDNTLTPPRRPLNKTMTEVLRRLRVPFSVAAGSHISLLKDQFFSPLYEFGFRKQFEAFLSNGAIRYQCDYSDGMTIQKISEFNIRNHLDEPDYNYLMKVLNDTLQMDKFQLPSSIKILGNRIVDRVSMINFCPIGRMDREDSEAMQNRKKFVKFDLSDGYRKKMIAHLNHELSILMTKKQLQISFGGQTSFDIGIIGQDKTKPIRSLLGMGFEKVVFIGDALFEGGNDAAISEYIRTWTEPVCPIEAIQTNSWQQTIGIIHELECLELTNMKEENDGISIADNRTL